MNQDSIFESLKYQFNEATYECETSDGTRKYKSQPFTKIKYQSNDYGIIEYDGKNPIYSLWFATYLAENDFSVDRVKEIRLIGVPFPDTMENLKLVYPQAEITILDKEISELEYEDLYCQHSLVFHFFGDLFLKEKAYKTEVCVKSKKDDSIVERFYTVPRRLKYEKLAKLIRDTRFIYNIFAYNSFEDMDWQMSEIRDIVKPDTKMLPNMHKETYVSGHLYITSIKWNEDDSRSLDPEIAFEDTKFHPTRELFYDRPLKDSAYLEGLSKKLCGQDNSEFINSLFQRNSDIYNEHKQSSPYEIASEFRIYKLSELYNDNDPICDDIIERFMDAANDGVPGALNNLGVFYIMTEQNIKAKEYLNKAIAENDDKALVNLYVLAHIEDDKATEEKLADTINQKKLQGSIWNKAIDLWNDKQYNQATFLFEKLSKEKEDKFQVGSKGLCQMAIKNLIKIYSEGKPEAGIEKNYTKVQKLLEKVDFEDNKELVACCLLDHILTDNGGPFSTDEKRAFEIIKELYDWTIYLSNHTYNMACCYAEGIGCKKDYGRAVEICQKYLDEKEDEEIRILKAYIHSYNGDEKSFIDEIAKIKDPDFRHRFNSSIKYEGEEEKAHMLELENVPGCIQCHEAHNYNEILRICPRVLELLGRAYERENNIEKAQAYYERSVEFGRDTAFNRLAKIYKTKGDIEKANELYRKAMYLGNRRACLEVRKATRNRAEQLRLLLLVEDTSFVNKEVVQYNIYNLLKAGFISRQTDIEYIWLKRSADNGYDKAIATYADKLVEDGNEYEALQYLRNYKGDDENVKAKLAELEDKFKRDDDDDDDDDGGFGNDDYYDEPDYDRDSWDAMTDGQYGDYPGPGWDPEMFGY